MPAWLRVVFFTALGLAGLSLFVLAATSSDSKLFERWFPVLLIINQAIAAALFVVVSAMAFRLIQNVRNRVFGAKMTARLALTVAGMDLIPCALIYFVSSVFISRSIDSWFDVRVEKALDSGVTITRGILTEQQQQIEVQAQHMASLLTNTPVSMILPELLKQLENRPNQEALVFLSNGTAVAAAGSRINVLMPDMPTAAQLQTVKNTGIYSVIDGDAFENYDALREGKLSIRVIVPITNDPSQGLPQSTLGLTGAANASNAAALNRQQLYLQLIQPVAADTAKNAAMLVAGYRDYQTLILSRQSLQSIYASTLLLVLLLGALGALASALSFARRTVSPVQQLEQGTRRLADGNFQPIREFPGSNEINVLTQSFNQMIREVSASRRAIDEQRRRAEQVQAYLERVLANISSGVVVLDRSEQIVTANVAARAILGEEVCRRGKPFSSVNADLAQAVRNCQLSLSLGPDATTANLEYDLARPTGDIPLFLKLSKMPLGNELFGLVIVFDDVTKLIEAQRATAWGEVARRLAHEIKNPLTPIQLAAERLELRLGPKLSNDDALILHRAISTISTQVDALKQMVNDFREYAKLPQAKLSALDLNNFLSEIAQLYQEAGTSIKLDFEKNIPLIEGDPAQLRQVLHNLIKNSIDAAEGEDPGIVIQTRHIVTDSGMNAVQLHLHDNGVGFSENILNRAFEPYITTKPTGTGLGLPMVKKILDEHRAVIRLSNRTDSSGSLVYGAQVDILFEHLAAVGRKDHSSQISNYDEQHRASEK